MKTSLLRAVGTYAFLTLLFTVYPAGADTADLAGPRLQVYEPDGGFGYIEYLLISGLALPAPDVGRGDRRIDTLTWELPELGTNGYIMFHRSGRFVYSVPTKGAEGPLSLILRLTDEAGRSDVKIFYLHPAPAAPVIEPVAEPVPDENIPESRVTIISPEDGSAYRSFVEVTGSVIGLPESISWRVDALNSEGPIELQEGGDFRFAFTTTGFSEPIEIVVTAVFTDRDELVTIYMENAGDGPYLRLDEPLNGGFYQNLLKVSGIVGKEPGGEDGLDDVKGLYWWFDSESESESGRRRPVFFDEEGRFSFDVDLLNHIGPLKLEFETEDQNANKTKLNISLEDGRLPPELNILFPSEMNPYGAAGLIMSGSVTDPYADDGSYGGIESLEWIVRPTDPRLVDQTISGEIVIGSGEIFSVPLYLDGLSGEAELSVIALGLNGSPTRIDRILPRGISDIPSFSADSRDESARLIWDPVPDAQEYQLSLLHGKVERTIDIPENIDGEFILDSLVNGDLYKIALTAVTPRAVFSSHTVNVIPLSKDTLKPVAQGEYRQIRLTWSPVPGASAYQVFRGESDGNLAALGEPVYSPGFIDTSARYGVVYTYSIAPASFPDSLSNPDTAQTLQAPEQKLEEVARYEGLVPHDLLIQGDYAFVAAGFDGFRVIDITDPVKPVIVGEAESGNAWGVAVRDDYAYLADEERGLQVINISAPVSPLTVGSRLAGKPAAVAVKGDYAYVADTERGLRVYDVSSAREPKRIHILEGFAALDLILEGRWGYVSAGPDGLAVVDLESPERPVLAVLVPAGDIRKVAVEDSLACVADSTGGLTLIDISNPEVPEILARIPDADAGNLTIRNGYLFISNITGGLSVYDARDPQEPRFFESSSMGRLGSLAFKDDYLYAGTASGIIVIQTYLVGASYVVSEWETPGRPHGISLAGSSLAVADHDGGFMIFDIGSEYTEPISTIPSSFGAAVSQSGNLLATADTVDGPGLRLKDSDTNNWGELIFMMPETSATDVDVYGQRIAYSLPESGVSILDISETGLVGETFEISFPGVRFSALSEKFAAASDGNEFRLYVINDDLSYTRLHELNLNGIKDLEISGELLLAGGSFGMKIFRLSEDGNVTELSTFPSPYIRDIHVSDNFVYLSCGPDGLQIVNIRNPSQPFLVSRCEEVFAIASQVEPGGGTAFVADTEGIKIVDLVIPDWLR